MASDFGTQVTNGLKGLLSDLKKDISSPEAIAAVNEALDRFFPVFNAAVESVSPGIAVPLEAVALPWLEGKGEAILDKALEGLSAPPPPPAPLHLQGAELTLFEGLTTPQKVLYIHLHPAPLQ